MILRKEASLSTKRSVSSLRSSLLLSIPSQQGPGFPVRRCSAVLPSQLSDSLSRAPWNPASGFAKKLVASKHLLSSRASEWKGTLGEDRGPGPFKGFSLASLLAFCLGLAFILRFTQLLCGALGFRARECCLQGVDNSTHHHLQGWGDEVSVAMRRDGWRPEHSSACALHHRMKRASLPESLQESQAPVSNNSLSLSRTSFSVE